MKRVARKLKQALSLILTAAMLATMVPQTDMMVSAEEQTEEAGSAESRPAGEEQAGEAETEGEETGEAETAGEEQAGDAETVGEETGEAETVSEETGEAETEGEEAGEAETEHNTATPTSELMSSDTIIASGSYDLITWDIDADGKLTVVGTGDLKQDWSGYCDKIISAEIRVEGATSAMGAFKDCCNLKSVDLSQFDTSNLTSTVSMFASCKSLTNVDLSGWNTGNVTNMESMFWGCESLTSVDLSGLDIRKVRSMSSMFNGCKNLTGVNLSGLDADSLLYMEYMFVDCKSLTEIDMSSFNADNLNWLTGMFTDCSKLRRVDLSGLGTSNVTSINGLFMNCSSLNSINLDGWNINKVERYIYQVFQGCDSLTSIDLSNVEMSEMNRVLDIDDLLREVKSLDTIYTPVNLTKSIALPTETTKDVWYQADGTQIRELPQNLSYSIVIKKNEVPVIPDPYITVTKTKTSYDCGDIINTDDITVTYYDSNGASRKLTEGYTTNAAEINMTTPGKKELVVTYGELTATVELSVTCTLQADNAVISLPATECIYNGWEKRPVPAVSLKAADNTQAEIVLQADEDYTVSYQNNVNAGVNTAQVTITGIGDYKGSLTQNFTITPAQLTITAKDMLRAVGEALPVQEEYEYSVTGLYGNDVLLAEPTFTCAVTDMSTTGTYTIMPSGANAGGNYTISYAPGTLTVAEERVVYTVSFDLSGHGTEMAPITGIKAGSLIREPEAPTAEGYTFGGWYTDRACTKAWNFTTDTVQESFTLYACWTVGTDSLRIQEIPDQTYTGSAVKPAVRVYGADGSTLLKAGKDYTIKYNNNINVCTESEAALEDGFARDLAYVTITGKGNYKGTVSRNFRILPASIGGGRDAAAGITLKYTDQLTVNKGKAQKPFGSMKYKKAMKAGTDYAITLTTVKASAADGTALDAEMVLDAESASPAIPAGYSGTFLMKIEGKGNYTGTIAKTIYVSDRAYLLKNVSISLGKNQKRLQYQDGAAVCLTPGYYDAKTKKYYKIYPDGTVADEPNGNNLFTVKNGKTYLRYGVDYRMSYRNNRAVGTATMTITGTGKYSGSKSVTYAIIGTAFNAKNVIIGDDFKKSVSYTGRPQTQNSVKLTTKAGAPLNYGEHYTIRYKNNIRKGTATMQFIAKPESGFSGSFSKTFKITAQELKTAVTLNVLNAQAGETIEGANGTYTLKAAVPYSREGAKAAGRITVERADTRAVLKEGTDYTVSYANNKTVTTSQTAENKKPVMTIKGKGNYTGTLKVFFSISEAGFAANDSVTVTATPVALNQKKADDYQYQPKIKVTDGKKALKVRKDYTVEYKNCSQAEVKSYLSALANGGKSADELEQICPKAVITTLAGSGYTAEETKTVHLAIYQTKLTTGNLYVIVSQEGITYTGAQVTPEVTVYYGDAKAVKAAKKANETDPNALTDQTGSYKLRELTAGDYRFTYGANVAAGKNKGTVTVTGTGLYGGSVTTKFNIMSRDVR